MTRWLTMTGLSSALVVVMAASGLAQTVTPPASSTYESLSPGHQKIARALYDAQNVPATVDSTTTAAKPLTLDQIAAQKQSGRGWGQVFKDMKAQGLVQDKNLGQVISRYNHRSSGVMTTASGRALSRSAERHSVDVDDAGSALTGGGSHGHGGGQSSTANGGGQGHASAKIGGHGSGKAK